MYRELGKSGKNKTDTCHNRTDRWQLVMEERKKGISWNVIVKSYTCPLKAAASQIKGEKRLFVYVCVLVKL